PCRPPPPSPATFRRTPASYKTSGRACSALAWCFRESQSPPSAPPLRCNSRIGCWLGWQLAVLLEPVRGSPRERVDRARRIGHVETRFAAQTPERHSNPNATGASACAVPRRQSADEHPQPTRTRPAPRRQGCRSRDRLLLGGPRRSRGLPLSRSEPV